MVLVVFTSTGAERLGKIEKFLFEPWLVRLRTRKIWIGKMVKKEGKS
jgi:hypothetical protein